MPIDLHLLAFKSDNGGGGFAGGGNKKEEKRQILNKKISSEKTKDKKNPSSSKSSSAAADSDDDEDDDDDSFKEFLQRISQWPLAENLNSIGKNVDEETIPTRTTSVSSGRNPFLSPFASLLHFDEEVIWSTEKDSVGDKTQLSKKDMDVISSWSSFMTIAKQSFGDVGSNETAANKASAPTTTTTSTSTTTNPTPSLAGDILKGTTNNIEYILSAASTAVSPDVFSSVIKQARNVLKLQDDLISAATSVARDRGLDDSQAAERARNTTDYMASLVAVADQVLRSGYVKREEDAAIGDRKKRKDEANQILEGSSTARSSAGTPLFDNIASARAISYSEFGPAISTIAEMGWLSGGIYEQAIERSHELGHSIVAEGISADVYWMITDSTENEADFREDNTGKATTKPGKDIPVRTIIIRGFDASDERVDREQLFTEICNPKSRQFDEVPEMLVHRGLYALAKEVYNDLKKYINWSAPAQKIIFTGHSVGGSIGILITLMLARDRGAKFVRDKILRVFTFGSPPCLMLNPAVEAKKRQSEGCKILDVFGLPSSLVYGSVQPWDPIPRLFSPIDGLYPLVDDIGPDGVTLYARGPPRSLRLVARGLVNAWEGWPKFRNILVEAGPQKYQHAGTQHIIMPEPVRYLTDRFVKINVQIPAVDEIVRLSPDELYKALETIFPLDVFELSYLTNGIRGFLHHFYPAYDSPLVRYAQRVSKASMIQTLQEKRVKNIETESFEGEDGATQNSWGQAEAWLKSVVPAEPTSR